MLPLRPLRQACNQKVLTATQHLFTLCWFLWQQVHGDFWPIEWKVINSSSLNFSIVLLYLQPWQTINQYLVHRIHPPIMKLRIWISQIFLQFSTSHMFLLKSCSLGISCWIRWARHNLHKLSGSFQGKQFDFLKIHLVLKVFLCKKNILDLL